jgi:hypothetical protein
MLSVILLKLKIYITLYMASRTPKRAELSKENSKILTLLLRNTFRLAISQRSGRKICSSSESRINKVWKNENILFTST